MFPLSERGRFNTVQWIHTEPLMNFFTFLSPLIFSLRLLFLSNMYTNSNFSENLVRVLITSSHSSAFTLISNLPLFSQPPSACFKIITKEVVEIQNKDLHGLFYKWVKKKKKDVKITLFQTSLTKKNKENIYSPWNSHPKYQDDLKAKFSIQYYINMAAHKTKKNKTKNHFTICKRV